MHTGYAGLRAGSTQPLQTPVEITSRSGPVRQSDDTCVSNIEFIHVVIADFVKTHYWIVVLRMLHKRGAEVRVLARMYR